MVTRPQHATWPEQVLARAGTVLVRVAQIPADVQIASKADDEMSMKCAAMHVKAGSTHGGGLRSVCCASAGTWAQAHAACVVHACRCFVGPLPHPCQISVLLHAMAVTHLHGIVALVVAKLCLVAGCDNGLVVDIWVRLVQRRTEKVRQLRAQAAWSLQILAHCLDVLVVLLLGGG